MFQGRAPTQPSEALGLVPRGGVVKIFKEIHGFMPLWKSENPRSRLGSSVQGKFPVDG